MPPSSCLRPGEQLAGDISNANRLRATYKGASAQRDNRYECLKAIMHFQVAMLRTAANIMERFAGNHKRRWTKPRPLSRNSRTSKRIAQIRAEDQWVASIALSNGKNCFSEMCAGVWLSHERDPGALSKSLAHRFIIITTCNYDGQL
jgi:hypothetical protein